jgi:iron complex outermembrane receptor protein
MSIQEEDSRVALDLDGNEVRTLQLELGRSFDLEMLAGSTVIPGQGALSTVGTGVSFELGDRMSLVGGTEINFGESSFQSLGSIHCQNGTLDSGSYKASNCYFVDERGSSARSGVLSLGAHYQLGSSASASLNVFQSESSYRAGTVAGQESLTGMAQTDPVLLGINPGSRPFVTGAPALGLESLESSVTGVDLEFQVGISMDRAGDVVLGLQLTRVLDNQIQSSYLSSPGQHNWSIAEPYDSARLSFDWYKGSFSGGLQSYYREPVDFLNRTDLDRQSTFDVHFTWRAPWNASVSVGASNVLNSGVDDNSGKDNKLADPLESVYGRIPYVRYKQDL